MGVCLGQHWAWEGEGQDWQLAGWAGRWGTKVSWKETEAGQRAGGRPLGRGPQARLPPPPWRAGCQTPRSVLGVQLLAPVPRRRLHVAPLAL